MPARDGSAEKASDTAARTATKKRDGMLIMSVDLGVRKLRETREHVADEKSVQRPDFMRGWGERREQETLGVTAIHNSESCELAVFVEISSRSSRDFFKKIRSHVCAR